MQWKAINREFWRFSCFLIMWEKKNQIFINSHEKLMKDLLGFCRSFEWPLSPQGFSCLGWERSLLGTLLVSEVAFELKCWASVLAWCGVSHTCAQPQASLTPTWGLMSWPGPSLCPFPWPCPALCVVSDPTDQPWTCWVPQGCARRVRVLPHCHRCLPPPLPTRGSTCTSSSLAIAQSCPQPGKGIENSQLKGCQANCH